MTLAANSLTFRIPVAVMNLATVYTNVVRDLALVLTVGNQTMFAGVISINITAPALIPAGADVTIGSVRSTLHHKLKIFNNLKKIKKYFRSKTLLTITQYTQETRLSLS